MARIKGAKKTNRYPDEFKVKAVLDGGIGSDHRGYNMKSAELFRNGQTKPEVLKESKE
jgi:hypothetical protein